VLTSETEGLISASQIRAARSLLGWTQQQLANKALISLNAVARLEQEKGDARVSTVLRVRRALEEGGIRFLFTTDSEGIGVRINRP
jgi:predicted transcriptional regulator